MSMHEMVRKQIASALLQKDSNEIVQLNNALRLLAKHRSVLIQNTFIKNSGLKVAQGPLAGLDFVAQSAEGCHIAKLLGCYEQPIQTYIEDAIGKDYEAVINIGCAEGYYAVGMACKMPYAKTFAYDINESAQKACVELAIKNNVSDRVEVNGLFSCENFEKFDKLKVLVFCDIEGAELELIDPTLAPSLKNMDLIIEAHEFDRPGIVETLKKRFSSSHLIEQITDDGQRCLDEMPDWFLNLSHLDQLLAVWEWRSGPTPWLIMKPK